MNENLIFPDKPGRFIHPDETVPSCRIETIRTAPFAWRWEALRVDGTDLHVVAAGVSPVRGLAVSAARRAAARL